MINENGSLPQHKVEARVDNVMMAVLLLEALNSISLASRPCIRPVKSTTGGVCPPCRKPSSAFVVAVMTAP
ncbi:hypothetical protein D3C83_105000 [compost metagenome]